MEENELILLLEKKRDEKAEKSILNKFIRIISWFGPIFCFGLIFYVDFVQIFIISIPLITHGVIAPGILFLIFFNISNALLVVSYIQAIFKNPGTPSVIPYSTKYLEIVEGKTFENIDHSVFKDTPNVRICHKCMTIKPKRAHHCSTCEKCVLKMDHHCPWLNNCVGWGNQKCFNLFLFYIVTTTLIGSISGIVSLKHYSDILTKPGSVFEEINLILLTVVCGVFFVGMLLFFLVHLYQTLTNGTSLDKFFKGDRNKYDLGCLKNWNQVMGENPLLWFWPVCNQMGDGCKWPKNSNYKEI
eukprot:TRINITY_DN695_c0_g1_i1.p1 TRINITY_DN695_c0_g1~~TRINITY_DN695_c0_g1_i1.p1  ORF type:complete len:300 (-),score=37.03 TRINITY_DN695_c0_g1_i1:126-1025(-)